MSEIFPFTSSGTQWAGVTDRMMGGVSNGDISRQTFQGRNANVLHGKVSLKNKGGFIQMATDLSLNPSISKSIDASNFDGIELTLFFEGPDNKQDFNVHLKTDACTRQFSSYRATFSLKKSSWRTVRLRWDKFIGFGACVELTPLDLSTLRRLGIVAIGKEMDVTLGLSSIRFFRDD